MKININKLEEFTYENVQIANITKQIKQNGIIPFSLVRM